jgi:hypothetical protein
MDCRLCANLPGVYDHFTSLLTGSKNKPDLSDEE